MGLLDLIAETRLFSLYKDGSVWLRSTDDNEARRLCHIETLVRAQASLDLDFTPEACAQILDLERAWNGRDKTTVDELNADANATYVSGRISR